MFYCTRCHRHMRRSSWGSWFEHIFRTICESQSAYWAEER